MISCDSKTATIFVRAIAYCNIPALPEHSFYNFRARWLPKLVIRLTYATCAISHDSKTATFFARPIAHAIIPALSEEVIL